MQGYLQRFGSVQLTPRQLRRWGWSVLLVGGYGPLAAHFVMGSFWWLIPVLPCILAGAWGVIGAIVGTAYLDGYRDGQHQ